MRYLFFLALLSIALAPSVYAQSNLLENVKRNPKEAVSLCNRFRNLNAKGISSSSKLALDEISRRKNLSITDAEILSIYVIGLHCPDVN